MSTFGKWILGLIVVGGLGIGGYFVYNHQCKCDARCECTCCCKCSNTCKCNAKMKCCDGCCCDVICKVKK